MGAVALSNRNPQMGLLPGISVGKTFSGNVVEGMPSMREEKMHGVSDSGPIKLWDHQAKAIPHLVAKDEFCLFFEPGTGKTATMIHGLRGIYNQGKQIRNTLIFAPLIVLRNWKKEFKLHSKISSDEILVLDQTGKKRTNVFSQKWKQSNGKGFIVITNYEAVQMRDLLDALRHWGPEILILDESHRVKSHESKRAKEILSLARLSKRRYLLTGTPILNSALDIFMQFRILERDRPLFDRATSLPIPGASFGDNFFAFRANYFMDVNAPWKHKINYFPKWEPRPTAHEELNKIIYRKSARVLKSECLDLPPLVRQTIEVDLSKEQLKLYDQMKKDYIAFLDDHAGRPKTVVAQLALTKALRLQQICSGYVKTDDGKEISLGDNPRDAALKELLEDLTPQHKVIVWAVFRHNYKQIEAVCQGLKLKYGLIVGELSAETKAKHMEAFANDPETRVMIANQSAGGIGINLTAASYSIFYSRNFSLESDIQAEARNYRGGSEIHEKITRIDLVAPKTIDALVLETLARKQKISDQILEWSDAL